MNQKYSHHKLLLLVSSHHCIIKYKLSSLVPGEDAMDFTFGVIRKLSLQAAHDKRNVARNIKRRRATSKGSLFLHQNEQAKYGTDLVDPAMINVSNIIIVLRVY